MNSILELCKNKTCTGCYACESICPNNAITFVNDLQGFSYPHIDSKKCVNCSKCEKVCPKLSPPKSNDRVDTCYAAMANDSIRQDSSSGGVFTVLANAIIESGGVVCGATMDDNYDVYHYIVDKKEDLALLRKSKYVQSSTKGIYSKAKKYLVEGKKLLFSGCPCQIAAARNLLSDYRDQILYVDIICHGVPSNQMWKDYLHENFNLKQIQNVEFRSKLNGWRSDQLRVFWNDGSSQPILWGDSAYEEGFQRNITLRQSCINCEFSGLERQGDLTIGDYWQCEKYLPELNDRKGTSLLFINNKYGYEFVDKLKNEFILFVETPVSAAKNNRLSETTPAHPMSDRFRTLYPGHSFTDSVMQCRHALYDIGLVGLYCVKNFGGQLTQYALYYTLTKMGYSVLMIECPNNSKNPASPRGPYLFKECPYPSYAMAKKYNTIAEMKFFNKQCKTFVTGSDQMFNNNSWNNHGKFMSLHFVNDNHRKIAYAASWGHDRIWGEEGDRGEEAYFLRKFDFFSVREDSAVKLAKTEFGVDSVHVLDPVFLCPKSEYERMANLFSENVPEEKYLFSYMLDPDKEKENILRECAKTRNLYVRAILDEDPDNRYNNISDFWDIETIDHTYIENLIAHITNSTYVITDSFHGMCLCIILHKEFLAVVNKRRGESRFTSLAEMLNLKDRLCYTLDEAKRKFIELNQINYTYVEELLASYRDFSLHWLKNSIDCPAPKKSYTGFDVVDNRVDNLWRHADVRCDDLNRKIDSLIKRIECLEEKINGNEG